MRGDNHLPRNTDGYELRSLWAQTLMGFGSSLLFLAALVGYWTDTALSVATKLMLTGIAFIGLGALLVLSIAALKRWRRRKR